MKHLYETLCNSSNLKLLCGKDFNYSFPLKYPKAKDPKKLNIKTSATLAQIIKDTDFHRIKSFDERFDKRHPIELAVEQLYIKGFTDEIIYKILKNKASVNQKQIKGVYSFLANFITQQYRLEIIDKLKLISIDKYGRFIRNGVLF